MKPILFNTEMVRAILDGRKTATRRVIKPQPEKAHTVLDYDKGNALFLCGHSDGQVFIDWVESVKMPICVEDILWARETWNCLPIPEPLRGTSKTYWYLADDIDPNPDDRWRPSIHMPRESARLFLRVTDVRVKRLQDMNGTDLEKEGVVTGITHFKSPFNNFGNAERFGEAHKKFADLWNSTIKKADLLLYDWEANPWVFVIEFERIYNPA